MSVKDYETLSTKLESLLEESGKKGPAEFFKGICERLVKNESEADVASALQDIIMSGKLPDMAGFNEEEDRAYDELYKSAQALAGESKDCDQD